MSHRLISGRLVIATHNTGKLKVSSLHEIYYEESGNSKGKPVVFLQYLAQFLMGKSHHLAVIHAGHGFGGNHSIDDRFLRGPNCRKEYRIELLIRVRTR